MIDFFVEGVPQTQGSKIPGRTKSGRMFLREVNSGKHRDWRDLVARVASGHVDEPFTAEVVLDVVFVFVRPKSHFGVTGNLVKAGRKQPFPKKDLDKLIRAVGDSLTDAGVWNDDAQVTRLLATKRWAQATEHGGVRICVTEIEGGSA